MRPGRPPPAVVARHPTGDSGAESTFLRIRTNVCRPTLAFMFPIAVRFRQERWTRTRGRLRADGSLGACKPGRAEDPPRASWAPARPPLGGLRVAVRWRKSEQRFARTCRCFPRARSWRCGGLHRVIGDRRLRFGLERKSAAARQTSDAACRAPPPRGRRLRALDRETSRSPSS